MSKKYLITSALPYANGPLHFGHLAGAYLPADVYTRHRKLQGNKVIHISGSDEHGVAIMLNAQKEGLGYKEYVDNWHREHAELFAKYGIEFDYFGQTSALYHEEEVIKWFKELNDKGFIGTKDEQQLFCNDCKNHLPDRFVEGTCYVCKYEHARGDECPNCGEWIEPAKLIDPVCKICTSKNIEEVSVTQYYLLLSKYHDEYKKWFSTKKDFWRKTVYPFVESLTKEGLHDRAITRDLDWGIDVPLAEAKGKKLYVWFDAPIGYVSNTKEYCKTTGEDYLKDWWQNDDVKITNFIGKDNIIFHAIIFPMMSMASGRVNAAYDVPANQYVNLAGKQFSKSSGWYVDANKALDDFGATALRYYLISLIPESSDSSFTWEGLAAKVNGELANNIGNLVNRCLKFSYKNWQDGISGEKFTGFSESDLGKKLCDKLADHNNTLDQVQIRRGLEKMMSMGHDVNEYFSDCAPWAQFKEDPELAARTIAQTTIAIYVLAVGLSTYLPELSNNITEFYGELDSHELRQRVYQGDFSTLEEAFAKGFTLTGAPKALVPKIDDKVIAKLTEELGSK